MHVAEEKGAEFASDLASKTKEIVKNKMDEISKSADSHGAGGDSPSKKKRFALW